MACSIKIKENLIANIEQRTNDVMNKDLFTANKRAQYINSLFGYKVVSFSQSEKDFMNRKISVPDELVQKYYDNETLIEQEEARQIQSEDALRIGEEVASNDYMFQRSPNEIAYTLKAMDILQSPKADEIFRKGDKNNWDINKILQELQVPKEQQELIKTFNTSNREEILTSLLANYSYAIEINIAKQQGLKNQKKGVDLTQVPDTGRWVVSNFQTGIPKYFDNKEDAEKYIKGEVEETPTQYYSNLTVPGFKAGTYKELRFTTPLITPSIKGHAQFAEANDIGWSRVADTDPKTKYTDKDGNVFTIENGLIVFEEQSDLFQKGRDKKDLDSKNDESGFLFTSEDIGEENTETNANKFLQLLNKDNNWVTFFVKSIIQDSAKKGYEKVLFPSGNTSMKIEGHTTLEEFKKQKEDRIKELTEFASTYKFKTKEEADNFIKTSGKGFGQPFKLEKNQNGSWKETWEVFGDENTIKEIEQIKQELERVETEGFGALKPIYNFYENTVTNILKKNYNINQITDEYGNTWNEITIENFSSNNILLKNNFVPASKANPHTVAQVKQVAQQLGINIQSLEEYAKNNSDIDITDIQALAETTKGVIAVAQGMEDVALTEEMVHIATAIIEQTNPQLITTLISRIDKFKIYKQVLKDYSTDKNYQLADGKPNIRKIKKEAVDKLLTELIINQSEGSTEYPELQELETRSTIQTWWDTILEYIRSLYGKSTIDLFNDTATKVIAGDIEGTSANLTNDGEIYFQRASNPDVDTIYDTILDRDERLQLNPETPTDKRHYTFDGNKVEKSVTEKVKSDSKMPAREGIDAFLDEQKRDWGSEGHDFFDQFVTNSLIDKDGYKKETPTPVNISSPIDDRIQEEIKAFAIELINSYAPGTRFIIEKKVVNEKVKGMLASTVDFIAIEPNEQTGYKIDVLDWKFSGVNKEKDDDIPWFKQKEWKEQMGEYTKILYNYGVKPVQLRKTRMIPFITNYEYNIPRTPKSGLQLKSLEIGKLDSTQETNLYLLPVPLNSESTGNPIIDTLLKSLREQYEKLYKTPTSELEGEAKNIRLNQLSAAIRTLHLKLDFSPLVNVGKSFLNNAAETFKSFENIDYSQFSKEEIQKKLGDLLDYAKSAEKYASLDDAFLSQYKKDSLSEEDRKTLISLEHISSSTGRMLNRIKELQEEFVVQLALKENFTEEENKYSILDAEKAVSGFTKTFLEASQLSSKLINLAANLVMNAASVVNIKLRNNISEFEKVLHPLEQEAKSKGVKAFNLIGETRNGSLSLIRKIDSKFWEEIREAKVSKDKKFFLANMDVEQYNKLAQDYITKQEAIIDNTHYSSDEETNEREKDYAKVKLNDRVDINRKTFNGYETRTFSYFFNQALIEEPHYSKEYLAMSPQALAVWNFFTQLNNKGKELGYLDRKGATFFPLIEATIIEKIQNNKDVLNQGKDFFEDLYTTRVNEQNQFSKIDPETGEVRKSIPKYFTRTDKALSQLSTDLNKVGVLWMKSLLEYENARNLENTLLTLHSVEQAKGSLMVDVNGDVIFENGVPKINEKENKNAAILETLINDAIYKIREDIGSLGNTSLSTVTGKFTEGENKENTTVSIKKGLKNADTLVRALAVGLKPLIGLANWAGYQFQNYINSGNFYKFIEFEKNNLRVTTSTGMSTIERGLLDLIVPLNEDVATEERRKLAFKEGYLSYISTWSFSDVMMITNSFPERRLQFANAMSFNQNSMVVDGKIVNIRQYVKNQDRKTKYSSQEELKSLESTFEARVAKLKETSSLLKTAIIEGDKTTIPNVSIEELAKYRTKVVEYGRTLNGQMNENNKAGYRRDTIFNSFMMFKTWIPKLVSNRAMDIKKNQELKQWEYGRTRAFLKTWVAIGLKDTLKFKDIIQGTPEGLKILDSLLEQKKEDYYRKTGQTLDITQEEFYDMMRTELTNTLKELQLLFGMMSLLLAAKISEPPEDASDLEKNRYKFWAKAVNKISDEIIFYYNPASMDSITRGSIVPALGLGIKVENILTALAKEGTGILTDNEELLDKTHTAKYIFNIIPGAAQFQTEILPYVNPELAKEMGIKVTSQSRRQ